MPLKNFESLNIKEKTQFISDAIHIKNSICILVKQVNEFHRKLYSRGIITKDDFIVSKIVNKPVSDFLDEMQIIENEINEVIQSKDQW